MDTKLLFNRDVSWLSFNYRVFEEVKDKSLPLYERIKFLAIFISNLEEFYKIRVAYYRNLIDLPVSKRKKIDFDPSKKLTEINNIVVKQNEELEAIFNNEIIPELRKNNIYLYDEKQLLPEHKEFIKDYFAHEILPQIQPVLLESGSVFSFLQDNVVYLAIKIFKKTFDSKLHKHPKKKFAIIKLPTHYIPRFIELPRIGERHYIIFLDDIIRFHLKMLFPGYVVDSCYAIKLSRSGDILIEDEYTGNLAEKIKKNLSRRKTGAPSRFLYDKEMPKDYLQLLTQVFNLAAEDLVVGTKYPGLDDLFSFPNPLSPQLEVKPLIPLSHSGLDRYDSMFSAIKSKDWILHFPYHSYKYVLNFLNEAAIDPKVEEIMTTQYRVATNSAVVSSLISAARNGKKVTVFVEVKARFDEENNLYFAEEMKKAGIKVISSFPKIKVHAKVALVLRRSSKDAGKLKGYAFLGTGNFNEKTAKLYADHGLFTYDQKVAEEIHNLFKHFSDRKYKPVFESLLVGQFNLRDVFKEGIEREIKNVEEGKKGYMLLKMNGLDEPKMINKLYEASEKGVKIDLVVRGVCRLVPDQPYSKNIRIIRIVDMFLEHVRMFVFYNNGSNDTYLSSADWMRRNLYRRIETSIKIRDEQVKQEILDILQIQLKDNIKGGTINENLKNIRFEAKQGEEVVRAQMAIYNYIKEKEACRKFEIVKT